MMAHLKFDIMTQSLIWFTNSKLRANLVKVLAWRRRKEWLWWAKIYFFISCLCITIVLFLLTGSVWPKRRLMNPTYIYIHREREIIRDDKRTLPFGTNLYIHRRCLSVYLYNKLHLPNRTADQAIGIPTIQTKSYSWQYLTYELEISLVVPIMDEIDDF